MFNIPIPDFKPRPLSEILAESALSPNAFNYWFGAVEACKVLSPATISFDLAPELQVEILDMHDLSDTSKKNLEDLVSQIQFMGKRYGFPLFIKTSFTSGKHDWSESCCLPNGDEKTVLKHLAELVNFQAMCVGELLSPSLVIRQMIDTDPAFHAFQGMPITEEYRLFTKGGKVEGYQPYWPEHSIENPDCEDWQAKLKAIKTPNQADLKYMTDAAEKIAAMLGDHDWSVDFLRSSDGQLWLIDMAVASQSYRNEAEFRKRIRHPGQIENEMSL